MNKALVCCLFLCSLVGCAVSGGHDCAFNASYINEPAQYWPTVHVAGKVFDVDQDEQRFDFVKNAVYDEQTGQGMARHCVHWSDQTKFMQTTTVQDLSEWVDSGHAVFVRVRPANDNEAAKLANGEAFTVSEMTIYPMFVETGASVPEGEVCGYFRADGLRSGRIEALQDGVQRAPVSLTRRATVTIASPFDFAQLSTGHWSAIVSGEEEDGRFAADRVTVTELPDPTEGDDTGLPRVLVIGDSISMNYNDALVAELQGIANVHRCEGNSFSSNYGMQYADFWMGNYEQEGLGWDVIQFNHGLHDLKQAGPDAPYATSLEDYQQNLRRIITRLQQSGATLIFCTTTPVPISSGGRYGRQQGAEIAFNHAALQVVAEFPEIRVTDLCAVVNGSPVFDAGFRSTADVHFYAPQEQQVLGQAVAEGVRSALEAREAGR